jgi:hypothetical protein
MKDSLHISQAVLFDLEMLFSGCLAEALGLRLEFLGSRRNRSGSRQVILGWLT